MDLATLYTLVVFPFTVSLRVEPNRLQFFQYERVSLSCSSSNWTIIRNTSSRMNQRSSQNKSIWVFNQNIYHKDAGLYWCESDEGKCGSAVNISVTAGDVVLESPVQPVSERETVTLRCISHPDKPKPEGLFEFFKDGSWIRNSSSGNLTLSPVTVNDSGLYMCRNGEAQSAESRLEVRPGTKDEGQTPPDGPVTSLAVLLAFPVAALSLFLVCVAALCVWRKRKERVKPEAEYCNVNIVHTPQPRLRERVKPDAEYCNVLIVQTPQTKGFREHLNHDDHYCNVNALHSPQPRRLRD